MNIATLQRIPEKIPTESRPIYALIGVWVLSMISLPIFRWTLGDSAIVWGVNVTTVLQAVVSFAILVPAWGVQRALRTALIVIVMTWGVEAMGTATGFPFGHYDYTAALQPQLLNVPILIALAWFMMLPAAWAVGQVVSSGKYGIRFMIVSALAMTAWDFFLDPQMVGWGLWEWESAGNFSYFGIPWINFVGWFATAIVVTLVARPRDLPVTPLLTVYVTVWVLQTIGQLFFWGLIGPAIVGFFSMGIFVVLAFRWLKTDDA